MDAFLDMSTRERGGMCEQAGAAMGIEAAAIEKDFWVCWTLRELFALPSIGANLTFKGGTSLSKGWKLIERFSEDIDVVVDRESLGFGGDKSPEAAEGSNERQRRLDALADACRQHVHDRIRADLDARLHTRLSRDFDWRLVPDEEDKDQQTLLLTYPAVLGGTGYLRPVVRLEFGARSDVDPTETPEIQPYLAEQFPKLFPGARFAVSTVAPRRTFWEKAMLLHEEALRGADPKPRLARHYYDLWNLIGRGVADEAAATPELFRQIATHRAVYFRKNQKTIESLKPGTLQMLPPAAHMPAWRRDYESMRESMIFGKAPGFDEILAAVEEFQNSFNAAHARNR